MKFFILLFCTVLLFSCSEQKIEPKINALINDKDLPSQESWNSTIYFSEGRRIKAVLFTKHLKKFDDKHETLLDEIKIDFYSDEGIKNATLTSKRGRVDDLTRNLYAIDSVVAVSDSGVTLTTQELMWNNYKAKLFSDKFVRIVSETEVTEGYGMEADQSLQNYVIYDIVYSAEKKDEN